MPSLLPTSAYLPQAASRLALLYSITDDVTILRDSHPRQHEPLADRSIHLHWQPTISLAPNHTEIAKAAPTTRPPRITVAGVLRLYLPTIADGRTSLQCGDHCQDCRNGLPAS
ncbi:hypothetical protein LIA77_11351 [Sarocladium implicatum]|nr:hypothetical protein LIA77_11351 [Sarocladium implicatum]